MAKGRRILVLTQDPELAELGAKALAARGRQVVQVRDVPMLPPLTDRGIDLVLVDLNMPDTALQEAAQLFAAHPETPVLVLGTLSSSIWESIAPGNPLEVGMEPPYSADEVREQAENLLDRGRFLAGTELVGSSAAMRELRERILLVAPSMVSTILLTGESGSGKDQVARAIHDQSPRRDEPFKPINCAAIPDNLLENELFGHEKGAFTDAKTQYRGVFEQGDRGTVFLDEIGEMSVAAQVRLLRVLEQREVTRIGGSAAIAVDIRVVAATNKNLQAAVAAREFRRDLYHRLKVVELEIPPLRRRAQDVPVLLEHFRAQLGRRERTRFDGFSEAAVRVLTEYAWPGNVRELRNLVEHMVFLGPKGKAQPEDILPQLEENTDAERSLPVATSKTPDQSERELIYFALLDLKREVSALRDAVEKRVVDPVASPLQPVYQYEDAPFAPSQAAGTPAKAIVAESDAEEEGHTLKALERDAIERALTQVRGNRQKAAEMLGISVRTLYRKLHEYDLK
jgi:DNA-binding NtrC family response regulator